MEKKKDWIQRSGSWSVITDQEFVCNAALSPQARLLYLIMLSHAGPEESPMPPISELCASLRVGVSTYRKYCRELTDNEYLKVEPQRDEKNRFSHNRYVLLEGKPRSGMLRPS